MPFTSQVTPQHCLIPELNGAPGDAQSSSRPSRGITFKQAARHDCSAATHDHRTSRIRPVVVEGAVEHLKASSRESDRTSGQMCKGGVLNHNESFTTTDAQSAWWRRRAQAAGLRGPRCASKGTACDAKLAALDADGAHERDGLKVNWRRAIPDAEEDCIGIPAGQSNLGAFSGAHEPNLGRCSACIKCAYIDSVAATLDVDDH